MAVSRPRPMAPSLWSPPRRFQGNSVTPLIIGEESLGRTRHYYFRRCKRMCPTNIHCLPNELLSKILARLPADHLHHRARLVCRRWYHIILSDAFVQKHFHHSAYGLLLACLTYDFCRPIFMTATRAGQVETYELSYKYTDRLLSSCNGFLLEVKGDLSIANPTTNQSLLVPPLQFPRMIPATHCCCMAFAASSMKYKIALAYSNLFKLSLAVLTIGVDNSWRNVETEHLPKDATEIFTTHPVTSEGFIHWVFGYTYMITMDVETEILTWRKLPLPKGYKKVHFLSTGRFISIFVGFRDLFWEIWGMNSETGEWRKVLPDLNLGALFNEFAKHEALRAELKYKDLVPIGWVNYPKVLAFGFSLESSRTCILYNRETHDISSVELPQQRRLYRCHAHRNSLRILC